MKRTALGVCRWPARPRRAAGIARRWRSVAGVRSGTPGLSSRRTRRSAPRPGAILGAPVNQRMSSRSARRPGMAEALGRMSGPGSSTRIEAAARRLAVYCSRAVLGEVVCSSSHPPRPAVEALETNRKCRQSCQSARTRSTGSHTTPVIARRGQRGTKHAEARGERRYFEQSTTGCRLTR